MRMYRNNIDCCVPLYSQNDVLLYTITNKDDAFSLSFCHRLSLSSTVSDAVFIDRHHLVVLQTVEGATATAYKLTDLCDVSDQSFHLLIVDFTFIFIL